MWLSGIIRHNSLPLHSVMFLAKTLEWVHHYIHFVILPQTSIWGEGGGAFNWGKPERHRYHLDWVVAFLLLVKNWALEVGREWADDKSNSPLTQTGSQPPHFCPRERRSVKLSVQVFLWLTMEPLIKWFHLWHQWTLFQCTETVAGVKFKVLSFVTSPKHHIVYRLVW